MSARDVLPDVRVTPDAQALSVAAAAWVADELAGAVNARGRASFVLSGGSTPRTLYELLAGRFNHQIPWTNVHAFWSDERYVPHDHPLSNYRMAKEALLDHAAIPSSQIHAMPTHFAEPQAAARAYEHMVADYFASTRPIFDVMLLGIGADGHTASVFPGSPAISSERVALAVTAPAEPPSRLTLTLPVIASARRIGVLVSGAGKADALAAALGGEDAALPAAALARTAPAAVWWVDRDAWGGDDGVPR